MIGSAVLRAAGLRRCERQLILGQYGPGWLPDVPWFGRCRLSQDQLKSHMYVVGRTRQGKSKFLQHIAYQLIALGQGCAIIDPHADLADDLVACVHTSRDSKRLLRRIVYFDPSRKDWLPPFNVLSAPWEAYTVAQNVLEAFRRTWPESLREAPRFSNIVLAASLVLIENRLTLVDMPRLLTDPAYRATLLARTSNPELTRFFRTRYDRWGREQALIAESVLNKLGALALNPTLQVILGQRQNALPFRQIMDGAQVLICNLGRVDAETRRLLGSLIVSGLEQAARSRTDSAAEQRRAFYLIIDEFQDYMAREGCEQTLAQILSECRKFGLHVIMAHQYRSQLGLGLQGALENAQIKVIFGVGRNTARMMAEEVFRPEPTAKVKGAKESLAEQWERFTQQAQRLGPREVLVQIPDYEGVRRLRTCNVPQVRLNARQMETLREKLARQSGRRVSAMRRLLWRRQQALGVQDYESIGGEGND